MTPHVPHAQEQPRHAHHVPTTTTSQPVNVSLNAPMASMPQSNLSVLLVTQLVPIVHRTLNVTPVNQDTTWTETHVFLNVLLVKLPTNKTKLVLLVTPTSSITRLVLEPVLMDTTVPPTRHALLVLLLARLAPAIPSAYHVQLVTS